MANGELSVSSMRIKKASMAAQETCSVASLLAQMSMRALEGLGECIVLSLTIQKTPLRGPP